MGATCGWVRSYLLGYVILVTGGLSGLLLLPLMLLSRRFREAHFAFFYSAVQRLWKEDFDAVRRALMLQLDDLVSHDASLRDKCSLRVLEVGAAYGGNLPFVRRDVQYWKVEPNARFDAAFERSLKENPHVELVRSICGYGEDMAELPDGHFDAVILTYVLCSAADGRKMLSECRRVLTKVGWPAAVQRARGTPQGNHSQGLPGLPYPVDQAAQHQLSHEQGQREPAQWGRLCQHPNHRAQLGHPGTLQLPDIRRCHSLNHEMPNYECKACSIYYRTLCRCC
ncbi:thiol S-methyltransferase TMT1B-like isoform X2 [Haemaphysalis longicornis]